MIKNKLGSFDEIYSKVIKPFFKSIKDKREENQSYSLIGALKSGFAIYSLKSPSLLAFNKLSKAQDSNLKKLSSGRRSS
ncbi:MAG: hypothetical protein ACI8VT_002327 [Saprospiraceae bacterium]|jgi:hypothetical protein